VNVIIKQTSPLVNNEVVSCGFMFCNVCSGLQNVNNKVVAGWFVFCNVRSGLQNAV